LLLFVAHLRLRFHCTSQSERVLKISLQDVYVCAPGFLQYEGDVWMKALLVR
jgi:hypothetical protein